MFSHDPFLRVLSVGGEVSNCKYHTSGHIYFSLKDETGTLSCIMFAGSRGGLGFRMKDGDRVIVKGTVDVFERDGKYQLYARQISLEGAGRLYEKFLRLKQELSEMGMFDAAYKVPIPAHVEKLGVVTAPTGAVIQDIRNVSLRRNPFLQIILYPAKVQGDDAADSIVKGIRALDAFGVDVIIVGRGGGSMEDLAAFNEESVARAIFACQTPVISAVGHETDFTIADFVADLRAPTPSAAAELAVDDRSMLLSAIRSFYDRLVIGMTGHIKDARNRIERDRMMFALSSPQSLLRERQQFLVSLEEKMQRAMEDKIQSKRALLALMLERFEGLSPLKRLNAGYSFVTDEEGKGLISIGQVSEGSQVTIHVSDGKIRAAVQDTQPVVHSLLLDS